VVAPHHLPLVEEHVLPVWDTFVIYLAHGTFVPSIMRNQNVFSQTHFVPSVEKYIEKVTAKTMPKKILVCMIYYPDENPTPSWATASLGALGYNSNPVKLQTIIRKMFLESTRYVVYGSIVLNSSVLQSFSFN
jgi:hypothetical protein